MAEITQQQLLKALQDLVKSSGGGRGSFSGHGAEELANGKVPDSQIITAMSTLAKRMDEATKAYATTKIDIARRALGGKDNELAEKAFFKRINELAEHAGEASDMVKEYSKKMQELKGDAEGQQKLFNAMNEYAAVLEEFEDQRRAYGKTMSDEQKKELSDKAKIVRQHEKDMKSLGVIIKGISNQNKKNGTYSHDSTDNIASMKLLNAEQHKLVDAKRDEIRGIREFNTQLKTITFGALKGFGKALIAAIPGRLQNVQTEYNFATSAMRGMDSTEFAEFKQKNRSAQILRGPDGAFNDGTILAELRKIGLTGKDAAEQQGKLYGIGMSTGSGTSDSAIVGLSKAVTQFAMLEDISVPEATAQASEMLNTPAMLQRYVGKTQEEILEIQRQQLVVASKTSKLTGLGAMATMELAKEQREKKYSDIVERFKKGIYGEIMLDSYNSQVSDKYKTTKEEDALIAKDIAGGIKAGSADEAALLALKTNKLGFGYDEIAQRGVDAQLRGDLAGGEYVTQLMGQMAGMDWKGTNDLSIQSAAKLNTEVLATRQKDLDAMLGKFNKSVGTVESSALRLSEIFDGIGKSPISPVTGAIGDALSGTANLAMTLLGGRALIRGGSALFGGAGAGAAGAAGAGAAGIFGKLRGAASKGSVGGIVGGLTLGYGADKLDEAGHTQMGGLARAGSGALTGAGIGAALGSFVPIIGNVVGAGIGAAVGGAYGLYDNADAIFGTTPNSKKATSGVQSDEQGNPIPQNSTTEQLLSSIDKNTLNMVDTMIKQKEEFAQAKREADAADLSDRKGAAMNATLGKTKGLREAQVASQATLKTANNIRGNTVS